MDIPELVNTTQSSTYGLSDLNKELVRGILSINPQWGGESIRSYLRQHSNVAENLLPTGTQINNFKQTQRSRNTIVQSIINHIGTRTILNINQQPPIITDAEYEAPIFFGFQFNNTTPLLGTGTEELPFLLCSTCLYVIKRYQITQQTYPNHQLMMHADQTYGTVECGFYLMAIFTADGRTPSSFRWRMFDSPIGYCKTNNPIENGHFTFKTIYLHFTKVKITELLSSQAALFIDQYRDRALAVHTVKMHPRFKKIEEVQARQYSNLELIAFDVLHDDNWAFTASVTYMGRVYVVRIDQDRCSCECRIFFREGKCHHVLACASRFNRVLPFGWPIMQQLHHINVRGVRRRGRARGVPIGRGGGRGRGRGRGRGAANAAGAAGAANAAGDVVMPLGNAVVPAGIGGEDGLDNNA